MTDAAGRPDPAPVLRALGFETAAEPTPLSGGRDNYIWSFDDPQGRAFVLRMIRKPAMSERAANEATAHQLAHAAGLPVPNNIALGEFEGHPVFVQERMPGKPLAEVLKARPWAARAWGRRFGVLQARLHRVEPTGLRRFDESPWRELAGHAGLIAAVEAAHHDSARVFCHLDFHPMNVLVEGGEISALLDFTNAAAADVRTDLGLTWAILEAAPLPGGVARRAVATIVRRFALGWREGYERESGGWPLDAVHKALGIAVSRTEAYQAHAEGRGNVTQRNLDRYDVLLRQTLGEAGITP